MYWTICTYGGFVTDWHLGKAFLTDCNTENDHVLVITKFFRVKAYITSHFSQYLLSYLPVEGLNVAICLWRPTETIVDVIIQREWEKQTQRLNQTTVLHGNPWQFQLPFSAVTLTHIRRHFSRLFNHYFPYLWNSRNITQYWPLLLELYSSFFEKKWMEDIGNKDWYTVLGLIKSINHYIRHCSNSKQLKFRPQSICA